MFEIRNNFYLDGKPFKIISGAFHYFRTVPEIGPQKRLYIPAPLLKIGENTIVIFETEGKSADSIFLAGNNRLA